MKTIRFALPIILILTLVGCDEFLFILQGGGETGPITAYPLGVGNRWSYTRNVRSYNFRPLIPTATDPRINLWLYYDVEVLGERKLPRQPGAAGDTIATAELMQIEREGIRTYPPTYLYLKQETDGLYMHGYTGGTLGAPKPNREGARVYMFAGHCFQSVNDLLAFLTEPFGEDQPDSLMREYPPLRSIYYPLQDGVQWTFRRESGWWRIDKRVGPMLRRSVLGRQVRYHEVRWLYDLNNNGQWDTDISIIDQISDKGLVKRTIEAKDIAMTDPNGLDPIARIDIKDEFNITLLNVH